MDPIQFLLALMQLYSKHPFSETSGQRTRKHNEDLDGVANSPHLYWVGRDVLFDPPLHPVERTEAARRLGLRIITEQDHQHIQPADWIPG